MVTASSNNGALLQLIPLDSVLSLGNATLGNDMILTDGDSIVGEDKSGPAGAARLLGGNSTGLGGDGGDVVITVGSPDGGGAAGIVDIGGDVDMDSDLTLAGLLTQPTGAVFVEQAAKPHVNVGGEGQVWVRDDAPNTLMFTDDANTDFVIGGALAPGLTFTTGALKGVYAVAVGEIARVDGSLAGTITFPAAPVDDDRVGVVDLYAGIPAAYTWFVVTGGAAPVQDPLTSTPVVVPIPFTEGEIGRMFVWRYSADTVAWILESSVNFATPSPPSLLESRSLTHISAGGSALIDVGAALYTQSGIPATTFDTVTVRTIGCVSTYVDGPAYVVTPYYFVLEEAWMVDAGVGTLMATITDDQTAAPGAEGHISYVVSLGSIFLKVDEGAVAGRTVVVEATAMIVACGGTVPV